MSGKFCTITAGEKIKKIQYKNMNDDSIKTSTVNKLTVKIRPPSGNSAPLEATEHSANLEVTNAKATKKSVTKIYGQFEKISELVICYRLIEDYLPVTLFGTIKKLIFSKFRYSELNWPSYFDSILDNQLDKLQIEENSQLNVAPAIERLLKKCKSSATIDIYCSNQRIVPIVARKFYRDVSLRSDGFHFSWSEDSETLLIEINDGQVLNQGIFSIFEHPLKSLQVQCLSVCDTEDDVCWCRRTELQDVASIIFDVKSEFEHLTIIGLKARSRYDLFDSFHFLLGSWLSQKSLPVKSLTGSIGKSTLEQKKIGFQADIENLRRVLPSLEIVHLIACSPVGDFSPCGTWKRYVKSDNGNEVACCDPKLSLKLKQMGRKMFHKIYETLATIGNAITFNSKS